MQPELRKFIGTYQTLFRILRNDVPIDTIDIRALAKKSNVSWPTMKKAIKATIDKGLTNDTTKKINLESIGKFAGIYLSEKAITLSIIDFSGKVVESMSKSFAKEEVNFFQNIIGFIKGLDFSSIEALSISSDEYYQEKLMLHFYDFLVLHKTALESEIPKTVPIYFLATSLANLIAYIDETQEFFPPIVLFNCVRNKVYINISDYPSVINFKIFDSGDKKDYFYYQIILPAWDVLKPNKMIFLSPDDKPTRDWIESNKTQWTSMLYSYHRVLTTHNVTMEVLESSPSKNTAIHAMYNYFGWRY